MKSRSFPLGKATNRSFGGGEAPKAGQVTREKAEKLAISALTFLASEPDQLDRFLALTGLTHENLRTISAESGFLCAVLEHLAGSETLLTQFCADGGHDPLSVIKAIHTLGGGAIWNSA